MEELNPHVLKSLQFLMVLSQTQMRRKVSSLLTRLITSPSDWIVLYRFHPELGALVPCLVTELSIQLTPLPHWQNYGACKRQRLVDNFIKEIVETAEQKRSSENKTILGVKKVLQASIRQRVNPANPPWWQERRRQIIAWANPLAEPSKLYLKRYHEFQQSFRESSKRFKLNLPATFPGGSWVPNSYCTLN